MAGADCWESSGWIPV